MAKKINLEFDKMMTESIPNIEPCIKAVQTSCIMYIRKLYTASIYAYQMKTFQEAPGSRAIFYRGHRGIEEFPIKISM